MKKLIIILFLIFASLSYYPTNTEAKMINKFKKGFYFEKYKTAEEAKEALLKMHPIGSDVDVLVKTLEKAGAKVREMEEKEIYKEWILEGAKGVISFDYFQKYIIFGYNWGGVIKYNKNRKSIDIRIGGYSEAI